ncbi:hypothetical protein VKT23_009925 [Stygiomarasmius scandens]|uniref:C2H2-type domain-containing protein n=1 Tax=Marasmiellus scandens TaxID=2682957 RepID=A0ABR1JDI6_9AGAR
MPTCSQCRRAFQSETGLRSHCKAKQDHHYCQRCNSLFSSASLLSAHFVEQHGMYNCVDCNRLISPSGVREHLASRSHLRRARSSPSQTNALGSTSVEPPNPSVSDVLSSSSPMTPSQPSSIFSQPVTLVSFSTTSGQGRRASPSERNVANRTVVDNSLSGHETGSAVVIDASFASSVEQIVSSTTSGGDETTSRERLEALRQRRAVIAAQIRELERQEEEIRLEEEQMHTRLSASDSMTSNTFPQIPSIVFSPPPHSEDPSQPRVFEDRPYCRPCGRFFDSAAAFRTHCIDRGDHPYCHFCERWFGSMSILLQHFISARSATHNHNSDGPRVSEVRTEQTVEVEEEQSQRKAAQVPVINDRHESDTRCAICSKRFRNKLALVSHQKGKKTCRRAFRLAAARASSQQVPTVPAVSASRVKMHECLVCSRKFNSHDALSQHKRSRTHKAKQKKPVSPPKPNSTTCPLCRRDFRFPSGVANHIESGKCTNGKVTRHHVTAAVRAMNFSPSITIRKRIAGSAIPTVTIYVATELAFNGEAYKCYLCNRGFSTLENLNIHLGSPAHDAEEF